MLELRAAKRASRLGTSLGTRCASGGVVREGEEWCGEMEGRWEG